MWGGRFTNKEVWKSNGQKCKNQEEAQSNPCSLSRNKLQSACWHWKYSFGDYTVANTALVIIQWHMSAISEGLYVNRGDPRSSLSFPIFQKQLPGQEKSLMKKRGWNRWQVATNCTDNVFALCQFKRAVFGLQVKIINYYGKYFYCKTALSSPFLYQLFRLCLPLFFPQRL